MTAAKLCSFTGRALVWNLVLSGAWLVAPAQTLPAEGASAQNHPPSRLAGEKSPYLLQHSGNPIAWYPWGEAAFRAARRENKPIFLSIGYSSCHWCHVMSGESFSDAEVGQIMNAYFIAVLVDREERPDVDAAYSRVLQSMIGTYGWPMNIFLTPAGKPFMGGTFIPRRRLLRLLNQFHEIWENDPGRIEEIGVQVAAKVRQEGAVGFAEEKLPDESLLARVFTLLRRQFDAEHGGFGSGAKFLPPLKLSLLLRIHKRTGEAEALRMVTVTLDRMARGGVHDHIGGGFHRYSADRQWHVPHFEKMLPDNAMLARSYLEAFQVTRRRDYETVARGTLDYILRDLSHPQGGFYAAEDSDSEKTEGKFYVWTMGELRRLLTTPELERIVATYRVSEQGNFNPWLKDVEENAGLRVVKNGNILHLTPTAGKIPDGGDPLLQSARRKLLLARSRRVRPYRDEKILTGWNGLAVEALAKGYRVLGEVRYLKAAQKAARFLLDNLRGEDAALFRGWRDGVRHGPGFLTDYAYLIRGLLALYQSDFDRRWFEAALSLQETQHHLFWDREGGGYFMSGQAALPSLPRTKPFVDETIPSGNAVAALNLLQTADLTLRWKLKKRVARIISGAAAGLRSDPTRYPQLLMVLDYLLDKSKEIAVVGPPGAAETRQLLRFLHGEFLPNKVLAAGMPALEESQERLTLPLLFGKPMLRGKTTTYVCENNVCRLPTNDLATVRKLVLEHRAYALSVNRE